MQEELHEQAMLVPWTDSANQAYEDIPLDDSAQDVLATNTSSPVSQIHLHQVSRHHELKDQHQHPDRHHYQQQQQGQQQQQQQQQQFPNFLHQQPQLQLLQDSSRNFTFIQQATPNVVTNTNNIGKYEYANEDHTLNTTCPEIEMRSDRASRAGEAGGGQKKGWKRKREEDGSPEEDTFKDQEKYDSSQRCDVCGESASGHYFGALVCLPCKSFFIRCTKDGRPSFNSQCGGKCDILKGGRVRCQHCRFQKCINAGMYRKEKPEAVEPAEGQLLCKVCGDIANGVHFGVTTCEGCKKFFRRGLKENKSYICKGNMRCSINPRMRNNCRYCRYQKCLREGMSREAIKMGRPKKGELVYRKTLKKNGFKQTVRTAVPKEVNINSGRSSPSGDYECEEDEASEDAFESVSSQSQNVEISHHQIITQLHPVQQHIQQQDQQQQQQHEQLQHHHSQQGGFSLGSLLHDCMTVEDWEDHAEIAETSSAAQSSPNHAIVMTSSVGVSRQVDAEEAKMTISPHPHQTSPTPMHTSHSHHQIHHHQQLHVPPSQQQASTLQLLGHIQDNQPDVRLHQSPAIHMTLARQVAPYQDKENLHEEANRDLVVMTSLDNNQDIQLPVVRAVKVEGANVANGGGVALADGTILDGMQTLQTLSKVDVQNYHLQGLDTSASFSSSNHNSAPISAVGGTVVPINQLDPNVVTVSVNQHGIIYTHPTSDTTPQNQNPNSQHSNLGQYRANANVAALGNGRQSIIIETSLGPQVMDMSQKPESLNLSQTHLISSQGNLIIDVPPGSDNRLPNSGHSAVPSLAPPGITLSNGVILHQHLSEPRSVNHLDSRIIPVKSSLFKSENSLSGHSTPRESLTPSVASNMQPNNIISQAMAIASNALGEMDGQLGNIYLLQDGKDLPIDMIQEQNQPGQPFQFRTVNTTNSDMPQENPVLRSMDRITHKYPELIQRQTKAERSYDGQQRLGCYSNCSNDHQERDQLTPVNRLTPPVAPRNVGNSSPRNKSDAGVLGKRFAPNQNSPTHCSPETENQNQNYTSIASIHANKNGHLYSIDSSPRPLHKSPLATDSNAIADCESTESTFNDNILSDTAVLHGINRIFLAIDNSCDSYGCKHYKGSDRDLFRERSFLDKMSPDDFLPDLSHMYWHSFRPSADYVPCTPSRKRVILEVLTAFDNLQKTYATSEPEYTHKMSSSDQWEQWHLVQRRIARHVVAGQRFCRNIPGYFKLDIQDRISLGKHAGFGLMVLLSCTEFYDPEFKRFRCIWNLTLPTQNPLFSYKVHLLSLGDRMHQAGVDRSEAALLCAISMTSIDCPGILTPTTICDVRDTLIDALEAHESVRTNSTDRVQELLTFMPQVRHMTMWYNNLMKKMSLPTEALTTNIAKLRESLTA